MLHCIFFFTFYTLTSNHTGQAVENFFFFPGKRRVGWGGVEVPFLISAARSTEASLSFLSISRQVTRSTTIQTLPGLRSFKVSSLRLHKVKLLKGAPNFCLWGVKAQSHEGSGRILLGDDRGGGAVTLRQIKFRCVGFWISNGLPCL